MISAHRGGAEVLPPETYEAFADAVDAGVEFVEFDVRRLPDGTLVCFHDETLAPTYAELCANAGLEVPLAQQVMELLAGRAKAHLDLKAKGYEHEAVALAITTLGRDGFVATSMEDTVLRHIAEHFDGVATGLSLGRGLGDVRAHQLPQAITGDLFPIRRLRACGATWAAINYRLAPWVLDRCARHGIATMVWTVDRTDQIDRLLADARVDVLVTNRPRHALRRRSLITAR